MLVAGLDLAFPLAHAAVLAVEIVAGRNWRNLIVLALLAVFILANLGFHIQAARRGSASHGAGLRAGLAAAVILIAVVGGHIVPSFTLDRLARSGQVARPAPPMQRLDRVVLILSALGLTLWVIRPEGALTGLVLLVLGGLHLLRLGRWQGRRCGAEPLVWILHVSSGLVPLGLDGGGPSSSRGG